MKLSYRLLTRAALFRIPHSTKPAQAQAGDLTLALFRPWLSFWTIARGAAVTIGGCIGKRRCHFMHISQIIFMGLLLLAFISACIKYPRQTVGGVIGGVFGLGIPALWATIYVHRGGDPTAVGALSFIGILTLPFGIVLGVIVANLTSKRREKSDKDKV